MTESVIKLPSQIMDEREAEFKVQMEEMEEQIAEKDAEIKRLQKLVLREANKMTESVIKIPSQFMDEMEEKLAEKDRQLADQKEQIADKDAKIRYLEEMLSQLMEEKRNTI